MSNNFEKKEIKQDIVSDILSRLGNLSSSILNSSGIIKLNLKDNDLRQFTFGKNIDELFGQRGYVEVLYALLQKYINYVKYESNSEKDEFSALGLMDYIDSHLIIDNPNGNDYSWLCSLLPNDSKNNVDVVIDAYYIVLMIEQSLFTDEERVYQYLCGLANDVSKRMSIKNAFLEFKNNSNAFHR